MKKYNIYIFRFRWNTYKHYFRDNTHISSDCFANAVEKTKLLSKQEGWKDIKSINEIGKIYL